TIVLDDVVVAIDSPEDLSFFCVTIAPPSPAYATDGLPQGAALWTNPAASGSLTVTEGSAAAASAAASRPAERALPVAGSIDARATGVRVSILDATGAAIALRPPPGAPVPPVAPTSVAATLGAAAGGRVPFVATLRLADAARAFGGAAQVVVE